MEIYKVHVQYLISVSVRFGSDFRNRTNKKMFGLSIFNKLIEITFFGLYFNFSLPQTMP